ncbi:DUF3667 domain-containing protein [Chryseobacterium populi]|uniref:DUF3667 domain-containing protein n=1 Tax=Chryseobacterium populi TaxID=1144316 RepID=J2K2I6_9FLAO|nr:DUF3667 domain-containing protein [Chryseobacterium populi]EJL67488.1 Protein of unknown function (DUF3667) [Chryseobacterium populi]
MSKKSCLNCGHKIFDEFCPHCGQKSDTARITPHSLMTSDILGSIWHIEARFFRTVKHILLGPGKMAMDYISGKRIKYYNLFSLLLILFGFNVLALHFYLDLASIDINKENSNVIGFFSKYSKASLLGLIPVMALNAWALFKRVELNLAEHIIIATVGLCGILVILLLDDAISIIGLYHPLLKLTNIIDKILVFSLILFPAFTYFNAFKSSYSGFGLIWRIAVHSLLMLIEVILIILIFYKIF